ncbi:MAG: ATPase [Chthoniobacteraceae bacterium]|jgi:hypothetical protein
MKPQQNPTTLNSEITHRLVVPVQTRGNIGKSTEAIARCEWMNHHGVHWKGYDLDVFNRTLSTTYPNDVAFVPATSEPEGEIIKILRRIPDAEVTVIDPSAHMNQTILKAFQMVQFAELAAGAQARVTVLVFPIDEVSDMDDISATVETLTDTVDWVVVRNRAKIPRTKFFDGSELECVLRDWGAAFLELPSLLSDTRNHLRAHEVQLGRGLSPAEALKNPELKIDLAHRLILEDWIREMFRRFDAIATHLLPTKAAAPITPPAAVAVKPQRARGAAINVENLL